MRQDITEDNRETVKTAFDAALKAYEALSVEDKAAFEATEQYKKLMALHTALYAAAPMANEAAWNISTGTLTLTDACGDPCGGHTVTGRSTNGGKIIVTGGTHNVTLNNVYILQSEDNTCAFEIQGGAVNLTLIGKNNELMSGAGKAGLQVNAGKSLTITEASTGSLKAAGYVNGAGIGGGNSSAGGNITINGGTVTATSDSYGAGIGGGNNGAGGTITINGGKVTAIAENNGAGIGGGYNGASGNVTISGGTVTATGSDDAGKISGGSGIGGGGEGSGGNIAIDGNAVVFAKKGQGNNTTQHIGGGANGSTGIVTKTGGIVFEGNDGTVYGTSVTPTDDFTVPADHTLTIGDGQTVDVSDITVKNDGAITGDITGPVTGNPPVRPFEDGRTQWQHFLYSLKYDELIGMTTDCLNKAANRQIQLSVSCFLVYRCKCTEYLIAPCLPKYAFFGECQRQEKPVYLFLMLHE